MVSVCRIWQYLRHNNRGPRQPHPTRGLSDTFWQPAAQPVSVPPQHVAGSHGRSWRRPRGRACRSERFHEPTGQRWARKGECSSSVLEEFRGSISQWVLLGDLEDFLKGGGENKSAILSVNVWSAGIYVTVYLLVCIVTVCKYWCYCVYLLVCVTVVVYLLVCVWLTCNYWCVIVYFCVHHCMLMCVSLLLCVSVCINVSLSVTACVNE